MLKISIITFSVKLNINKRILKFKQGKIFFETLAACYIIIYEFYIILAHNQNEELKIQSLFPHARIFLDYFFTVIYVNLLFLFVYFRFRYK